MNFYRIKHFIQTTCYHISRSRDVIWIRKISMRIIIRRTQLPHSLLHLIEHIDNVGQQQTPAFFVLVKRAPVGTTIDKKTGL